MELLVELPAYGDTGVGGVTVCAAAAAPPPPPAAAGALRGTAATGGGGVCCSCASPRANGLVMQPRADSLLTDLAHRVRLPAQLLVVLERCTLTLSRTRCPSPSGGSRVDGGRGSGARREQTNAAAYSRLWWRAAIRAAFQHSSLPSIRRARPVARPPVRARAHSRTVCLTFRHRQAVESVNRVVC